VIAWVLAARDRQVSQQRAQSIGLESIERSTVERRPEGAQQ
jgi:hypothetical protein